MVNKTDYKLNNDSKFSKYPLERSQKVNFILEPEC